MDFRQLEIFVAIVETGSFSQAGERLYLSQPAVTAHINALEKELDQPLLIRSRQGACLTEGGKLLYDYALSALRERGEALINLSKGRLGATQIRIAASSVPMQYLLPALLKGFREQYPDARFDVSLCDSLEVEHALHERRADIGFSGCLPFGPTCACSTVARDQLLVITPLTQRYASLPADAPFPPEWLLSDPMIVRESGSGTRRSFTNYLQKIQSGAEPNIIAVIEDSLAIKNAVAAGMGIAIVSQRAAEDYVQLGKLYAFPLGGDAVRELYILRRKRERLLGYNKEFFQFASEHISNAQQHPSHYQM
ncbi:MAG: selenium metabolism-associated LysR family transcriptional regulator [Clostridia bacterium]|nr:selenium metabolism-associated LysR family transcriptional regulator [Clostridia bacterium]